MIDWREYEFLELKMVSRMSTSKGGSISLIDEKFVEIMEVLDFNNLSCLTLIFPKNAIKTCTNTPTVSLFVKL